MIETPLFFLARALILCQLSHFNMKEFFTIFHSSFGEGILVELFLDKAHPDLVKVTFVMSIQYEASNQNFRLWLVDKKECEVLFVVHNGTNKLIKPIANNHHFKQS
jgi:hypothetical protein